MTGQKVPIFIGVMGMTGSGKSTFIKNLTKSNDIVIGTSLRSCTRSCQAASMRYGSHEIILVDTPGFDDTDRDDYDILVELSSWLHLLQNRDVKLSGLIYLHRITDSRMGGTAVRNLDMMEKLVGVANLGNIVLVTNRWEELKSKEKGEEVERELLGPGGFWHDMIGSGARSARYDGTEAKGLSIIKDIIHQAPVLLSIQEELMSGKSVNETAAGQALICKLNAKIADLEKRLQSIQAQSTEFRASAIRREQELNERLLKDQERRQELLDDQNRLHEKIMELEGKLEGKLEKSSGWPCVIQ